MRAFIAITDKEWFRFLGALPGVDAVNFWQPSARTFKGLQPGEPLLFKLHAPENYIVGGGFFVRWSRLPYSMAWEVFGQKDGAATIEQMRRRIERYRRVPPSGDDYEIGCIVLTQPFFFDRPDWFGPPDDFHPNIQTGKVYNLAQPPRGTKLWEEIALRTMARDLDLDIEIESEPGRMFGEPLLVRPRLGQGSFAYSSPRRTSGTVRSPVRRSSPCSRRRTSALSQRTDSTGSTTGSSSARTSTHCSTRAT